MKNNKVIFKILATLIICLTVFSISTLANDGNRIEAPKAATNLVNKNFDNIIKIVTDGLEEDGEVLDSSKFTLGKAYKLDYINADKSNYKNIDKFKEFIKESNEWLYIVNYEGNSNFYIRVLESEGNYEIVSFGGDAEGFNNTLDIYLSENKDIRDIKILDDIGDYYLIDKNSNLLKLSKGNINNQAKSKSFNNVSETMDSKILVEIIKESIDKEIDRDSKNGPIQYGSPSLWDLYQEYKVK